MHEILRRGGDIMAGSVVGGPRAVAFDLVAKALGEPIPRQRQ
jgi:hypothetical protein